MIKYSDLSDAIDLSTDTPVLIRVDVKADKWHEKLLQFLRLKSKKVVIPIYPVRLGTRERFSKAILRASKYNNDAQNLTLGAFHNLVASDLTEDVIEALAIAIHNQKTKAPEWLKNVIRELTQTELDKLIEILYNSLAVDRFTTSIIALTGMSLQPSEIIALDHSTFGSSKEI